MDIFLFQRNLFSYLLFIALITFIHIKIHHLALLEQCTMFRNNFHQVQI